MLKAFWSALQIPIFLAAPFQDNQIGRASCRERVYRSV